jgi:GMP synthase-like glutamine amidotransferase
MNPETSPTPQTLTEDGWRSTPGYVCEGGSDFESAHILLGRFLADRHSEDPLPDLPLTSENPNFEWGKGLPLEKVVENSGDLERLLGRPLLYRNSVAIIEPWKHVGRNPRGEEVRASLNVAYLAQKLADCDSVLFPLWSSGVLPLEQLVPMITSGVAVIVEGGDPSVRDADTFKGAACTLTDLQQFSQELILARSPTSAPALFICLGHQLAAQAHVGLLQRAVKEVEQMDSLARDQKGKALSTLKSVCREIHEVGRSLSVAKKTGEVVAENWEGASFAVGPNEKKEVGFRQLWHYQPPDTHETGIPEHLITAHEVTADEFEGVIDTSIDYEHALNISMFHSDEVNEESVLFANWAYRLLHDAIIPHRHILAGSPLSWLLQLPFAVEILCSTADETEVVTECSATCIIYKDFESKNIRRSFTCQFHPELLKDLRALDHREPPPYGELKQDDGARLFARLLYHGMQE